MADNRLDTDPAIRELRNSIDLIDEERAARLADWIVSTVVKLDLIESGTMDRDEVFKHWRPYNLIDLLTRQRDRRTLLVGERKKELEANDPTAVSTHQEGRWQDVKHTYISAVEEECDEYKVPDGVRYTALEWMHHYTEYEHERSKNMQETLRKEDELPENKSTVEELKPPIKTPHKKTFRFPWTLSQLRSTDNRQSA
jgi:hypothetical protein